MQAVCQEWVARGGGLCGGSRYVLPLVDALMALSLLIGQATGLWAALLLG